MDRRSGGYELGMLVLSSLWSPVETCRSVTHPVEAVFEALADPYTYPRWLVGAQRIRAVDDDFPAPGSEFHHSVGVADGATVDDTSSVLAVDAPHRLDLEVQVGPINGIVRFRIEPTPTGATIRMRERPAGLAKVLTPFTRPALGARNAESLRRLDVMLDDDAPPDTGA